MRIKVAVFALLLLFVGVPFAHMQDDPLPLVVANTEQISLTSETNERDYVLTVALPESYDSSEQSYPVLYVLDPQFALLSVVEFVRWLSHWRELPELIIVGIDYPTDDMDEIMLLREHDYYTAQDEFIAFISDEVFPMVDTTYRTDTADRGLVGFSYGANLVFYILSTDPTMFKRYIAIDGEPTPLMPLMMRDDPAFRESFVGHDLSLFVSSAGTEMLSAAFQTRGYEGITVTGLSLGSVTHGAALHLSLAPGIMAIYED